MKLGRRMSQCLFISYKQVDPAGKSRVATVQALAHKLGEPGLDCFVDIEAVQEFIRITQAIAEGLERATALLLYFTADYSKSAAYIAAQQNGWKPSERIFVP